MMKKPQREVDKKYLEYIKTLPCIMSGEHRCAGDVVPHHTKTRGSGGSDYLAVPMCCAIHAEVHTIGKRSFERKYNIDFRDYITKSLIGYVKSKWGVPFDPKSIPF